MSTIAFTGDIAFSGYFTGKYQPEILDKEIIRFLSESDYTVANIEAPVTDQTDDKRFHHSSPLASLPFFRTINANIWNLGNNHILDFGIEGLKDTFFAANQIHAQTIGVGSSDKPNAPLILGDNEIALISVTYTRQSAGHKGSDFSTFWWKEKGLANIIADAKRSCRWCIVISHCGDEFSPIPMPYVRKRYHKYLNYGADLVIGHHPHVVQNYETVGNKLIVYSLGNFVFDTDYQRIQNHSDLGMLVRINLSQSGYQMEHMAIRIDRESSAIQTCEDIPVFTDISNQLYRKYWPLAAKQLELNQIKKQHALRNTSAVKDVIKHFTHLRHPYGRAIFWGDIREKAIRYRKEDNIYRFLTES